MTFEAIVNYGYVIMLCYLFLEQIHLAKRGEAPLPGVTRERLLAAFAA